VTYQVVFDVSERLPQLAMGVVATIILFVVIAVGLWDVDAVLARWPLVLGLGVGFLAAQWLIGQLWVYVLGILVVTVVVSIIEWSMRRRDDEDDFDVPRPPRRTQPGSFGMVFGVFALVLASAIGLAAFAAIDLQMRLLDGQATVVEGRVVIEDHGKSECLVVDAQRFCYSDAAVTAGWNRRRTILGGPFDTGDQVRLSVISGQIVRIEVAAAS
jgi:hypothetical protein